MIVGSKDSGKEKRGTPLSVDLTITYIISAYIHKLIPAPANFNPEDGDSMFL
jgi:hypothetical protein